ncbi:hypothetical protein JMJ35_007676 [Cladonia borealis]|uniref:J domain-containing protein n=1 Tax=Cladonia borealis TaxID=184061 RepID=A0AA39UZY6_9LECA|nr:hypothetical protein JMJ35_007676 [Cladonia borealis]
MSYHSSYGHLAPGHQPAPGYQSAPGHQPAPGYYPPQQTAQSYMPPGHRIVTQTVQMNPHLVHVTETLITPGELLPRPRRTSHRQRSEREASEAYGYPSFQSKPKDHSGRYDQHRSRPEQPLHPRKAKEYQDYEQEADGHTYYSDDAPAIPTGFGTPSNSLGEYRKEKHKSTRSQQVGTKGHSSKPRYAQEYVESQPDAADKQAKRSSANPIETERKHTTEKATSSQRARTKCGSSKLDHVEKHIESQPDAGDKQAKVSSANPAGTESKHRTKGFTSATHAEPDSEYRPEKPGVQAKERTSTNTAGAGQANTTSHSSSTKFSARPAASHSGPEITMNEHKGSPININYDPKYFKVGVSTPDEKSMGHHGKEKPKESSQGSRSKKSVPDGKKRPKESSQGSRSKKSVPDGKKRPKESSQGSRSKKSVPDGKKKPKESSQGSWSEKLTAEDVPDYYAVLGCSIYDDDGQIARLIKKRKVELHPDRRVKSGTMSEQEIAKINEESALVNAAADVLRDSVNRWAYNRDWHLVYRKDEDGKTVPR